MYIMYYRYITNIYNKSILILIPKQNCLKDAILVQKYYFKIKRKRSESTRTSKYTFIPRKANSATLTIALQGPY